MRVRLNAWNAVSGLLIAGLAGAVLLLPALSFVGDALQPVVLEPSHSPVPPLVADAMWARTLGGRATELQPINPFTVGRLLSCHVLAERHVTADERSKAHDDCMTLMPAFQAVGYMSTVHLRNEGVWQDPRVPFAQIANMTRVSAKWTRDDLLSTLAERGEFGAPFVGITAAARGYFGREPGQVNVMQAAMLAGVLGNYRLNPWCSPDAAARMRGRVLGLMRENGSISAETADAADRADLGLIAPAAQPRCPS